MVATIPVLQSLQQLTARRLREVSRRTGVTGSRWQIGRLLCQVGCRRVRPRPEIALVPAEKAEKAEKPEALWKELSEVDRTDVVLFEDKVDIHLNPKVGLTGHPLECGGRS